MLLLPLLRDYSFGDTIQFGVGETCEVPTTRGRRREPSAAGAVGVSMLRLVPPILALITSASACSLGNEQQSSGLPPGVERVLPKDAIPAIFEPEFVSADQANLPPDAEVIGVVIKGEAKAYSINLLDGHEIVNDESAGVKFAVTW